jgi:hypothetical protein
MKPPRSLASGESFHNPLREGWAMRLRVVLRFLVVCTTLSGCGILGRLLDGEEKGQPGVNLLPRVKGEE